MAESEKSSTNSVTAADVPIGGNLGEESAQGSETLDATNFLETINSSQSSSPSSSQKSQKSVLAEEMCSDAKTRERAADESFDITIEDSERYQQIRLYPSLTAADRFLVLMDELEPCLFSTSVNWPINGGDSKGRLRITDTFSRIARCFEVFFNNYFANGIPAKELESLLSDLAFKTFKGKQRFSSKTLRQNLKRRLMNRSYKNRSNANKKGLAKPTFKAKQKPLTAGLIPRYQKWKQEVKQSLKKSSDCKLIVNFGNRFVLGFTKDGFDSQIEKALHFNLFGDEIKSKEPSLMGSSDTESEDPTRRRPLREEYFQRMVRNVAKLIPAIRVQEKTKNTGFAKHDKYYAESDRGFLEALKALETLTGNVIVREPGLRQQTFDNGIYNNRDGPEGVLKDNLFDIYIEGIRFLTEPLAIREAFFTFFFAFTVFGLEFSQDIAHYCLFAEDIIFGLKSSKVIPDPVGNLITDVRNVMYKGELYNRDTEDDEEDILLAGSGDDNETLDNSDNN